MSKRSSWAERIVPGALLPMDIADTTRLSLDGYRIQVLEGLKNCGDPQRARDVLAEVDVALNAPDLSPRAQRAFWEGLDTDLDVVADEWLRLLGKERASTLSAIIAAAKGDIAGYIRVASS